VQENKNVNLNRPAGTGVKLRVLVVDDDPAIATTLADLLSARYDTVVECDSSRALDILQAEAFDVVVTDYDMPYANGTVVCQQARMTNPGCRTIVMTGSADPDTARAEACPDFLARKPAIWLPIQAKLMEFEQK
jgi:CheY-like chemotaxis protein